jgi:hypothetical protein
MSRIGRTSKRLLVIAVVVLAMALATGTLFGPSIATAAQSVSAFITNTPANPVPVSVVAVPSTVTLASGAAPISDGELTTIVDETDVSAYKTVRLTFFNTDATCTDQQVVIYLDGLPSWPAFNYFPSCSYVSILIDTPGTTLGVSWFNHDEGNVATAYWNIVARP